ncbi:MAG: hypothetical protein V7609_1871 [Verrucomicrobiota bacterium]
MVTIGVVATMLVLLGSAIEYTTHISRVSQRSRKTAIAMEIADGHLEVLYSNWRNIYRTTWTTLSNNQGGTDKAIVGTNFFYTAKWSPAPAPTPVPNMAPAATPPTIPLPASTNFPSEANYTVTQYRIQAVDPMITLDANENSTVSPAATPPSADGPNTWQKSYFYLAAADVTVPTTTGTVTAKVRRIFEKKFDNPWTYAMFYVDDLEFQPTTALSMDGPIHSNGSLYIGTSNFTTTNRLEFAGEYVNGYSPLDNTHSGPTAPNLVSDMPPSQVSPYLPFGWNLNLDGTTNNNKSYHELIERPVAGTDPISEIRLYNQAGYRILIDAANTITITTKSGASINAGDFNAIVGNITTNQGMYDSREAGYIRVTSVDIAGLATELKKLSDWNGMIYISDTTAKTVDNAGTVTNAGTAVNVTLNGTTASTLRRAIRFKNGATLPTGGMTVVSENPIYIQGDFNTGGSPPSNSGTYTDPDVSGYTRRNAAIIGDAVTVLSGAWNDSNSDKSTPQRDASNTTVNAAIVAGNVPSNNSYSGGGENFVRLLEDWSGNHFTYYGSMVQLYKSQQGTGAWVTPGGTVYKSPIRHWYYDTNFGNSSPPGNLQIAAYLQQQRWYQVY